MTDTHIAHIPGSDVAIAGNVVLKNGSEIYRAAFPIAECAVMDDRIFLIMAVEEPDKHPDLAGANLVCIDARGTLIWTAPNLNAPPHTSYDPKHPHTFLTYHNLCIRNKESPLLLLNVCERQEAQLFPKTGEFLQIQRPGIDWTQPYDIAWKQYLEASKGRKETVFVASYKLLQVVPHRTVSSHSGPPSFYFTREPGITDGWGNLL